MSATRAATSSFRSTIPGCCGQLWARSGLVSGLWRTGARDRPSGAAIREPASPVGISAGHRRLTGSGGGFGSSCAPFSPAVARTHDGRDSRRLRGLSWASRVPTAGAEGLLDVLAGDLVAAGHAVAPEASHNDSAA